MEYEYSWFWSYDGIFTESNPGVLLGNGEILEVEELDSDPCINYFIQMVVYLDGEIVVSEVVVQNGGICSDNVQACDVQDKSANINEVANVEEEQVIEDVIYVVDILGRVLYVNSQNKTRNELQNEISNLYKGVYIMVGQDENNKRVLRKYISH